MGWDPMWDENINFKVPMVKEKAEKGILWKQDRQKMMTLYKSAADKVLIRLVWNFYLDMSTIKGTCIPIFIKFWWKLWILEQNECSKSKKLWFFAFTHPCKLVCCGKTTGWILIKIGTFFLNYICQIFTNFYQILTISLASGFFQKRNSPSWNTPPPKKKIGLRHNTLSSIFYAKCMCIRGGRCSQIPTCMVSKCSSLSQE